MLVLSRREGQVIKIGDEITITVVELCPDKVKLGFDAPSEIPIHRLEVYCQIKQDQKRKKELEG